MPLGGFKA
jgi:hypothetical protein